MINLNTKKVVSNYSANTKIVVVQKCITPNCTYYRTREAAYHYLNYAFRAADFGLQNEKAPSAPSSKSNSLSRHTTDSLPVSHTPKPVKKQKSSKKVVSSKGGEMKQPRSWISRIFRRNHGKTKNS